MLQNLEQLSARIAPERIAFVKFILEGYDNLAILSTSDQASGEIIIRFHSARRDELLAILDNLQADYGSTIF
jgi:hypothetical protein